MGMLIIFLAAWKCLRTPGVSLIAPPNSIKFLSRSKAQKGKSKEGSHLPADTLVELTKWLVAKNAGPSACQGSSPPSSVHGSSPDSLYGYLEFINISSHKRQAVYNTLISNDIDNFCMFGSLTYEELQALSFSVGIISKLRSNVEKYKVHLAHSG